MPHAGHFILGHKCRFHLATYVGGYIVSTVGELWSEREVREIHADVFKPEWLKNNRHLKGDNFDHAYFKEFGFGRLGAGEDSIYETMVFKARKSDKKKHCECCRYVMTPSTDTDAERYATSDEAYRGHLKYCKKYAKKQ